MLKRLRAKHPVGFCVLSEVLFLGSLLLASYLIVFALVLFGVDLERVDSYFLSAVQEAVGMVVALVILGRTGKMYLLRRRGSGFFNGLLVGMYPLVLIGYSLYTKLMFGMPEDGQLQRRSSSSAGSLPRACWSASAPAGRGSGKPACCRACCLARPT